MLSLLLSLSITHIAVKLSCNIQYIQKQVNAQEIVL